MSGFVPPPYPYERLSRARALAEAHDGGAVDLSIGTPCDPPPPAVVAALASSGAERGYPSSVGSRAFREAAAAWLDRTVGAPVPADAVLACVGTKEMVVSLPHWLRLRSPERDTVLYPALSYPSYAMGAELAGCRALPVTLRPDGALDLETVSDQDAARALCLWVNSPSNPTGALDDLEKCARWGRERRVPVISDECYVAFTWDGSGRSILQHGTEGVLALHSLSKRSNLAGLRAGFCAGDHSLVHYLGEVRKHAGLMVPGPVQAAAAVALADEAHVEYQRERYWERLVYLSAVLEGVGLSVAPPAGGFYLWAKVPPGGGRPGPGGGPGAEGPLGVGGGTAWSWVEDLAQRGGVLVSPGDLYGPAGADHLRMAMVAPMDRLELVALRLGVQ
ncbi:MAG: aminotransferase class I/II-fold pyridoxal phosphate-dependent enzyme [Acidimicrobiales bacterium]